MTFELELDTPPQNFCDITNMVTATVEKSGVSEGVCTVFCPHTTAALTINENADPDVVSDMLYGLDRAFPDRGEYRHREGNSAAHLKASCVGSSVQLLIRGGRLLLGRWQAIYFCEFDGPRHRRFVVGLEGHANR